MKHLSCLLALLLITSTASILNAQTPKSDSLSRLLLRQTRKDTTRVRLLNATAHSLYEFDNETMLQHAQEAAELAEKIHDALGQAEALRIQGVYHYSKSENTQAREYFLESLRIFEEEDYKPGISKCFNNLGRVHWKLGEYDDAQNYFEKALDVAEKLGDKRLMSSSLSSFGILSLQRGDYEEAIGYLEESSRLAKLVGDKKSLASNLHNIGYLHMRQSNYPEAMRSFEQTLELMIETGDKQGESGVLLNIGIILQNQGEYNEAIDFYQRSSEIDEQFGDIQGVSRCLNNIGLIYQHQGNYPLALEYMQRSLIIKEETGDRRGLASCLMNIGGIHAAQEDYPKSMDYFHRSLDILEELQDKSGISTCLMSMGPTCASRGEFDAAYRHLNRALELKIELGERYGESSCLSNLGKVHGLQENYQQALEYFQKSLDIKKELSDKLGICDLLNQMGSIYYKTGDYPKALNYTRESLKLAYELEALNEQAALHKQLTDIYMATRDYRLALENHILHKELYDSLFDEENVRRITGLEYQYAYDKEKQTIELEQNKKDALQAEKAMQQKIVRNAFILGFVLMVLLVVVVMRNFIQKRRANLILEEQNRKIERQNTAITDSISYARRIQHALFPPADNLDTLLKDYFILHKPRDIVSGDFYWLSEKEGKLMVAVADCTGHGVPGAFMSLLGIAFLNEIVSSSQFLCANDILNQLRSRVIQSLRQTGKKDEARDGIELALCIIDRDKKELQFSGAFRPLYLTRNKELIEIKADKMPIGIYGDQSSFTCHQLALKENDAVYLFSDGYVDQTGGPKRKTFKSKYFKELLKKIHPQSMQEQKVLLESTLDEWKGDNEQIDDILVMGIRV